MTINIYKQYEIAGKTDQGMEGLGESTPWWWGGVQSWFGINLCLFKIEGKLLVASLWNYITLWVNKPPPKRIITRGLGVHRLYM